MLKPGGEGGGRASERGYACTGIHVLPPPSLSLSAAQERRIQRGKRARARVLRKEYREAPRLRAILSVFRSRAGESVTFPRVAFFHYVIRFSSSAFLVRRSPHGGPISVSDLRYLQLHRCAAVSTCSLLSSAGRAGRE